MVNTNNYEFNKENILYKMGWNFARVTQYKYPKISNLGVCISLTV